MGGFISRIRVEYNIALIDGNRPRDTLPMVQWLRSLMQYPAEPLQRLRPVVFFKYNPYPHRKQVMVSGPSMFKCFEPPQKSGGANPAR
jgi:hypothetical protein